MFNLRFILVSTLSISGMLLSRGSLIQAQTLDITQLTAQLQEAVCLNEWASAIWATNQLIGHSETTPTRRQHFINLRQQYQEYNATNASFDFSGEPVCQPILAHQAQEAAIPSQVAFTNTPLDWNHAAQTLSGQSSNIRSSRTSYSSSASVSHSDISCPVARSGDREVASGSISSRWTYEIYQVDGRNLFYARYWPQNDCQDVSQTSRYETQDGAYESMRRRIENTAY